jgi:Cdc6-like AAA superfamily ATPase
MQSDERKEFWPPGAFIRHLAEKRSFQRNRAVQSTDLFEIHSLDLSSLKLNVGSFIPFVVARQLSAHKVVRREQIEQVIPELQTLVRESEAQFVVLVIGGTLHFDPADNLRNVGSRPVVIISNPGIQAIINAPNKEIACQVLSDHLVKYLGPQSLSPYRPGRPAWGGRFFGRQEALNRAVGGGRFGGNFTILGNRRIGKTSLLQEVRRRLERDNPRLRTTTIYGNNFHSAFDVVREILYALRPDVHRRLVDDPGLVDHLATHISNLPDSRNEDVAVFIDELDHILDFDSKQGYRLLNLLRASFEHDRCRVFFAGFRTVMAAKNKLDTPLYNFTEPIVLASLTRHETNEMIVGPLTRLGISVPPSLTELIMHETSGHPELIQIFCSKIVELVGASRTTPRPDHLVAAIVDDDIFRQKVYRTFLYNTNPMEKLLTYLLISEVGDPQRGVNSYEFTLKDCNSLLNRAGIKLSLSQIDTLVENLLVGGVIGPVLGRLRTFRFAVPRLAEYCLAEDLDFTIEKAKEEIATQPDPIDLLLDPSGDPVGEEGWKSRG